MSFTHVMHVLHKKYYCFNVIKKFFKE
uniref:Uncharacterized protein n=1 Tax=Rhizophora mucronata TaxID=61149 RepID=A0A2P2R023_RHIMU